MIGFPLQLPIDSNTERAAEVAEWRGTLGQRPDYRGPALIIEVASEAEATALRAWIAKMPVAVPL